MVNREKYPWEGQNYVARFYPAIDPEGTPGDLGISGAEWYHRRTELSLASIPEGSLICGEFSNGWRVLIPLAAEAADV